MTQKEQLVDLLKSVSPIIGELCNAAGTHVVPIVSNSYIADYLLNNGVRRVVRCYECEYLGIKGLTDGYCKKDIMGLVSPNDYCSRGKLKEGTQ